MVGCVCVHIQLLSMYMSRPEERRAQTCHIAPCLCNAACLPHASHIPSLHSVPQAVFFLSACTTCIYAALAVLASVQGA
jgi:hypothetical protein